MVSPELLTLSVPASPETILGRLRAGGPALVALSGGVDSAVVAALAFDALGPRARAATLVGPAISAEEAVWARRIADEIGIDHLLLEADPLSEPAYRANGPDRCYHCRTVEGGVLARWAAGHGSPRLLDGAHLDDLGEDRPGLRAMEEAGFSHPLVEAGWRKPDVRQYASERGLSNSDRPSNACLASRIATGEPVSAELLQRIERAEAYLSTLGFRQVRVRASEGAARVEVDPADLPHLFAPVTATSIRAQLVELGFHSVELDRRGYRRGGGRPS
ncbi:MAG TPA: ATP-dependent sacrificial sulfur transferase LarE [Thermoplasmata archaeon]|nr:ATP-dependent sacrificial sulfur transferase LarE [Thermoplasmata archaeon]